MNSQRLLRAFHSYPLMKCFQFSSGLSVADLMPYYVRRTVPLAGLIMWWSHFLLQRCYYLLLI
ncbi:hypothetical protein SCLCIDRAFT_1209302, partial [Scleroderma citrinum Foug A]